MKAKTCINLNPIFLYGKNGAWSDSAYNIYVAYDMPKTENMMSRNICVSENRIFTIYVEPDTDTYILIYSENEAKYFVEKLEFDGNVTMLPQVLDSYGVERLSIDEDGWEEWLELFEESGEVILWFDKGFYICDNPYLDSNICWSIDVFFTEGIPDNGKVIKRLQYGDGINKNKEIVISTINSYLSFGCLERDYKSFRDECLHPSPIPNGRNGWIVETYDNKYEPGHSYSESA